MLSVRIGFCIFYESLFNVIRFVAFLQSHIRSSLFKKNKLCMGHLTSTALAAAKLNKYRYLATGIPVGTCVI